MTTVIAFGSMAATTALAQSNFQTRQLSEEYVAEGTAVGDINGDGHQDVVAGPHWYEGPSFEKRHAFREPVEYDIDDYSHNFITFSHDFDGDGHLDILAIGIPGEAGHWYENPGSGQLDPHWDKHLAMEDVDNESPMLTELVDLNDDEQPELICQHDNYFGYATFDSDNPRQRWTFHPISPQTAGGRYTHGLGAGDIDGDGRLDFIEKNGWWEQPDSLKGEPEWEHHPHKFAEAGAQMLVLDVDGDGDNDLVTAWEVHGRGLAWHEQLEGRNGSVGFKRQWIMKPHPPEDNDGEVVFSQPHAMDAADFDGDGRMDFVTGKRFWAHLGKDPGSEMPAVLYWYESADEKDNRFKPHLIHDDSGVGTQVLAKDVNDDGRPDVIVSNKKGTYVHLKEPN